MNLKEEAARLRWKVSVGDDGDDQIAGRYGVIHIYGKDQLDVWITSKFIANRLEREGWVAKNHYDDGAVFILRGTELNLACKVIRARRRRVLSEARRLALIRAGMKYRLGGNNGQP